jgi:regulator of sigma E protease
MFDSTFNVLLILLGFGLVIFIHELGHFLAARWAGVRVHAFAIGFGPALVSFRKGLGVRLGSSEPEYVAASGAVGVSPTEYRLNVLPFGGYVKMLGQEDANPSATSSAPDSYAVKPVWKRMVIISAGVIMNVILAAALFVVVFTVGMREVAPVIGGVVPGSPAAVAGFKVGDVVRRINDEDAVTFTDLQIATAMAGPGAEVRVVVDRAGEEVPLVVKPVVGGAARMMQIGVLPETSLTLFARPARASERKDAAELMEKIGWGGVPMGSRLAVINGVEIPEKDSETIEPLRKAVGESEGKSLSLRFRSREGSEAEATLTPAIKTSEATATLPDGTTTASAHVVGLFPLLQAVALESSARAAGLVEGDVFVRVGEFESPDIATAISAIRAKKGSTIDVTVLRGKQEVQITAPVSAEGRIGFSVAEARDTGRIAVSRAEWKDIDGGFVTPVPGMTPDAAVVAVNEQPVTDFASLRVALKLEALKWSPGSGHVVNLVVRTPAGGASTESGYELRRIPLEDERLAALRDLPWAIPAQPEAMFQPVRTTVKAADPLHALGMGVAKTKRVLVMTYLTFARLFQGTVKVEHLKGPVGITDLGSRFAEEGFIYVLFFLGLISANLAVVNFLPLPIVDGGLFLMLCYEGLARRPVPLRVQNAVTIAGLALIGTMFLVVTFNDVANLLK